MADAVSVEVADGIGTITINRPEARNAVNEAVARGIAAAIGMRVNTICPGIIDTPIYGTGPASEDFKARLSAPIVFPKRMGTAAEFARLVRSLIENDYMNAEVVRFDGGIRFQPK